MKVSERIKRLRKVISEEIIGPGMRGYAEQELIQLEVEIVEALQVARQEGYRAGYQCHQKGAHDAKCNTETEV